MREDPSPDLIANLASAGLATRQQILAARRHAHRLARDLPLFESVWIDALVQARTLTPYQATQINAGRAETLRVDSYVLRNVVSETSCGTCFAARHVDTAEDRWLLIVDSTQNDRRSLSEGLSELCVRTAALQSPVIVPFDAAGVATTGGTDRTWVACPATPGVTAADWMVPEGRFPPDVVLEIARQMAAALADLERVDVVHGDICAGGLVLLHAGQVRLPLAGLRPLVRSREGYAYADRHAETYDYLAPERVVDGSPPTVASDLYACGLLWWHMLTGRPPLAGGNALAKLKAAQAARFMDVARLAPESPETLVTAIRQCTAREPADRPTSLAELAEHLGAPTAEGTAALARCLNSQAPLRSRLVTAAVTVRRSRHTPVWSAALAGCLLVALSITWPHWRANVTPPLAHIGSAARESAQAAEDPPDDNVASSNEHSHTADTSPAASAAVNTNAKGDVSQTAELAPGPKSNDLVLPFDTVTHLDASKLLPGQTIRADDGQRARVVSPAGGLVIDVDGLHFENIDFVASFFPAAGRDAEATAASGDEVQHSIISLQAPNISFRGCSFQPEPAADVACAAIAWQSAIDERLDRLPAAGSVRLVDCTLRGLSVGIDAHRRGPLEIELENTLSVSPGPLVRLHHVPGVDDSFSLVLERCTSRGAIALVDWRVGTVPDLRGNVFIEASDSVFALRSEGSLLRFGGHAEEADVARYEDLLTSVIWTGHGSLLGIPGRFATWHDDRGASHAIDDSATTVDGLVLSHIEFLGHRDDGPSASRAVDWSAPLRGDRPPGVSASVLVLPDLE